MEEDEVFHRQLARAIDATCAAVPELANARLVLSVAVMGDEDIRQLNRDWRGKDKPTNVLSFPMLAREELLALEGEGPPVMLGDLAFGLETVRREAEEKAIAAADHIAHLAVHGLLHLAGHDHETSDEDAERMEALEIAILAKMGIADPYANRDLEE